MSNDEYWFLQGGGISGETARSIDWARTPLGTPDSWPTVLKSTLATMFRARQPMFLWWGAELIQFYNDAYLPSFGRGKHPRAMGQRGRECWQEIWPIIGPQIEGVMNQAEASWNEDALVPIFRNGRLEEVYWTYSYSPVFNDSGDVAGTLVICTETTHRMLAERRTRTLHDFVGQAANSDDVESLARGTFEVLRGARSDIPFAVLCGQDNKGELVEVLHAEGLEPKVARLLCQKYAQSYKDHGSGPFRLQDIEIATQSGAIVPEVYIAPCPTEGSGPHCAFLFGISPALECDGRYKRFLDQLAIHLGMAKSRILEASRRAMIERERQNLLEQAPFATAVLVGPDLVFETANAKYLKMVARSDILGRPYLDVFPELRGTEILRQVQEVYRTGKSAVAHELPVWMERGQGTPEECYFSLALEPLRNLHGQVTGMMAVATDISEQVLSRRVLERANAEREVLLENLREASQAKDEFLAVLGHELRNPLAPILTALRLIREKEGDQHARERAIIERQVNYMQRLVDDLLDVSKIARGKVALRKEYVDLREVTQRAVEMAADLLEKRHHHFTLELGDDSLICHGDPVRLAQIITNLLTNAARYTEPHGHIRLKLFRDKDRICVSVRDDGIGIEAEMLPLVFNLFKQARSSSDPSQGGLGIGLTLVQNLVSLHGGQVSAHSAGANQGSEFLVCLPAIDELESARAQSEPKLNSPTRDPKKILLVDDNEDAVELLAEILTTRGHEVLAICDPLKALDGAIDFRPDCAVLDIGLPVVDGYELATRLRKVPGCDEIRLIALSGYGSDEDRRRGKAAGFEEHLVKPVDFDRLLELLDHSE